LAGVGGSVDAPDGYTYAAALVRLARGDVLAALREVRFTGWLARPEDGWLVAVARSGAGVTAAHGRGVVGVGEWLAGRLCATVLAVRVLADRQLALVAWADGTEIGRYVSDPSHGLPADEDVLAEPLGVEHAAAFAEACGRPETADDLAELLAETLDPDSVIESERLGRVLRLLGLPTWLEAGLVWKPEPGDRFVVPDRDLDEVFVLSHMTIEVHRLPKGTVIGFNGTTEWALDDVDQDEALWLPREDQLRELLGAAVHRLERAAAGWVVH